MHSPTATSSCCRKRSGMTRSLHMPTLFQCILFILLVTSYSLRLPSLPTHKSMQFPSRERYRLYLQQGAQGSSKSSSSLVLATTLRENWQHVSRFLQQHEEHIKKSLAIAMVMPMILMGSASYADDELAKYAAEGNAVGVDGQCFMKKCAIETSRCANDPTCLKGLSCLARCKGGSMCSTGCFAKYGSINLDNIISCSVEKNDCVRVPGKESVGWKMDSMEDLPAKPIANFDLKSLDGKWYKVMGLDSRYDCFDCQKNTFKIKDKNTLKMEAFFRIPRPTDPGFLQNRIEEELHVVKPEDNHIAHLQSKGEMFGLTFWENWYVLADSSNIPATKNIKNVDMKLIYYTGHTLQGNYKGAFLYSRTKDLSPELINIGAEVIRQAGLDPNEFCVIRNQCFEKSSPSIKGVRSNMIASKNSDTDEDILETMKETQSKNLPFWYLGENFFKASKAVAQELADWFQDPAIVSDWLVQQQERMVFTQPLEVSPFASLSSDQ